MGQKSRSGRRNLGKGQGVERLEGRRMLSAADIDLADLIARSLEPSTQTDGIVDSEGNRFEFVTIWRKPDEHTSKQPYTYAQKVSPSGEVLWSGYMGIGVTVKDAVLGPGGDLWAAGRIFSNFTGMLGLYAWRLSAEVRDSWRTEVSIDSYSWSVGDLAIDAEGNALLTGTTLAYTITNTRYASDAFISKLDPAGGRLWTTFVEGSGDVKAHAAATSRSGEVVIAGLTDSSDLDLALNTPGNGRFVTRIDPSGALIWSTYLHGDDEARVRPLLDSPVVRGTSGDDTIQVSTVPSGLQATVNGVADEPFALGEPLAVIGLAGQDRITITAEVTAAVRVHGGGGNDTIRGGAGNDTIFGEVGDDAIYGDSGDDSLEASEGVDSLMGGVGNDVLVVNSRSRWAISRALLEGGEGNDTLVGGGGNDTLYGYDGADRLDGALGADELYGNAGNDTLYGGDGNDVVFGQSGDDVLYGNFGSDTLKGGDGQDELRGALGYDSLIGEDGNDSLFGGDGMDTVLGEAGNDYIEGKGKADRIEGGSGNDTIWGGAGADLIYGGAGDDWVDVGAHPLFLDSVYAGEGGDTVVADGNDLLDGVEFQVIG